MKTGSTLYSVEIVKQKQRMQCTYMEWRSSISKRCNTWLSGFHFYDTRLFLHCVSRTALRQPLWWSFTASAVNNLTDSIYKKQSQTHSNINHTVLQESSLYQQYHLSILTLNLCNSNQSIKIYFLSNNTKLHCIKCLHSKGYQKSFTLIKLAAAMDPHLQSPSPIQFHRRL